MEVMKELNGYLEHNGLIYKIQSIEQLRDFMNGLGERAKGDDRARACVFMC